MKTKLIFFLSLIGFTSISQNLIAPKITTDKKELTELLNLLPNANYVLEYIRTNELSSAVVESAINQLKGIVKLNKQDLKLLKDFTSQYKALDE